MSDPRNHKLDHSKPKTERPFVSVHFACCNVYFRIYRNADGKAYEGRCPRCGLPVRFVVGPGGTDARTFVVRRK